LAHPAMAIARSAAAMDAQSFISRPLKWLMADESQTSCLCQVRL
jgi:hypothetical protein